MIIITNNFCMSFSLGKVKESLSAPSTPDVVDGMRFGSVNELQMQRSYVSGRKNKRENAAKLLWKSASRRLSAKVIKLS